MFLLYRRWDCLTRPAFAALKRHSPSDRYRMDRRLLLAALLALFLLPDQTVAAQKTTARHRPRPANPIVKAAKAATPKRHATRPANQTRVARLNAFGPLSQTIGANESGSSLAGMRPLPGSRGLAAIGMESAFAPERFRPASGSPDAATGGAAHGKAPLAYRYRLDKKTKTSINAGVGWIQDLDDVTGMRPSPEKYGDDGSIPNRLPGVSLNLGVGYRALTLTGGYIRALDDHASIDLALMGVERNPAAWNSELAYATELLNRETTLAVGYQRSSETIHTYLPEERYRTRASIALSDSTFLSLEYYLDKNNSTTNGEADGYGITTKIGFGF